MSSGLGLLFQVANDDVFEALDDSDILRFAKSGFEAPVLSRTVRIGGSVLIQHRHLWKASVGGTQTYAYDRGLGLSHWAALRGNNKMLQEILNGTIGGANRTDFMTNKKTDKGKQPGTDATSDESHLVKLMKDDESKLYCAVSQLGYSPLHFAVYAGSSECTDTILSHVEKEYSQEEFMEFINLPAVQKVEHDTRHLVLNTSDLTWIRETMISATEDRHIIRRLCNRCQYVSTDGNTPLHIAAQFCHTRSAVMLIESGAQVDKRNTLEGLDPHDIALSLQYHLEMMKGQKLLDGPVAEESTTACEEFINALDRDEDQRDIIKAKLQRHASYHWFQSSGCGSVWYMMFFICLIIMAMLYVRNHGTYGPTALKELTGEWGKDSANELNADEVGNKGELTAFLSNDLFNNLFGDPEEGPPARHTGPGGEIYTGYEKPYGSYYILGALRILILRSAEGTCFPRTVRRGLVSECWGPWSNGNNDETTYHGLVWNDFSGRRPAVLNQNIITDLTYTMFPTDRGLTLDVPVFGPYADENRTAIKSKLATIIEDNAIRFVAVQINFYHANSGINYLAEFSFEAPSEGAVYPMVQVTPYRLRQYTEVWDYIKGAFEIILFTYLIYFMLEECTDLMQAYREAHSQQEDADEEDAPHKSIPWLRTFSEAGYRPNERKQKSIKNQILRGAVQLVTQQVLEEAKKRHTEQTEEIFPAECYWEDCEIENDEEQKPFLEEEEKKEKEEKMKRTVEVQRTVAEDRATLKEMFEGPEYDWAERRQKSAMLYAMTELRSSELQTDIDHEEYEVVEFEIFIRTKLLWSEIEKVIAAHELDQQSDRPGKCCKLITVLLKTVWLHFTADSIWNVFDLLNIGLLLGASIGRFASFAMQMDSDPIYDRLHATNYTNGLPTGFEFQDLIPMARLEQIIRYCIAGAIVASGVRFLRHLMFLPRIGPVVGAIIRTILSPQVNIFLLCCMLVILPIWLAVHTAFTSTHSNVEFSSMFTTFFTVYRLFLGDWDFESWYHADALAGSIAFLIFVLILSLLFLNLLTGIVGNSYSELIDAAEKDWATEAESNYIITSKRLDLCEVYDAIHTAGFLSRPKHANAQAVAQKRREAPGKLWKFSPVTRSGFEEARGQRSRDSLTNVDVLDTYKSMYLW